MCNVNTLSVENGGGDALVEAGSESFLPVIYQV
jgi:hypothetical protein